MMAPANGNGHAPIVVEEDTRFATGSRPMGSTAPVEDGQSIGELFQDLGREARNLLNLELELARTEMSEKASKAGKNVGFIAAGGFVAYAGFLAIIFAVILALSYLIPGWLAALIVGAVVILGGYLLIRTGLNGLKTTSMAPKQTVASLQKDKEWLQEQRQ